MNSPVQRVINLIKSPKTEWPVIAGEPATVGSLYMPYVLVLAAIGPVAMVLGGGGSGFFRFSSGFLLRTAIWQYVASLVAVALFAFVINFLAPTFGATKDTTQSFKTSVYASTASWLGGIGALLGFSLGGLLSLAGAIYSIYLLYTALPHTMKAPAEKATSYTVVTIVVCIVVSVLLSLVGGAAGLTGGLGALGRAPATTFDPDTPLGKLEQAGRQLEKAEKEGKLDDPAQAMGQVLGAMSGAGAGATVEALSADALKAFVPESLAGLPRQSISAERNGAMGIQVAHARARYGEGSNDVKLEITDTGGAAGFMALAGWAAIESSSEEGSRTERVGREGGRMIKEVWDSTSKSGEYTVVVANRFIVEVQGTAGSIADLKAAATSVDLARLESLKNEGVKHQ
jgi:hypothetical protein